jgi:methylmalonyl-CoA mutase N-terminal domain/subunit
VSTKQEWLEKVYKRSDERSVRFSTLSDMEVDPLYTPEDVKDDYNTSLGQPGEYPYTRGVYESM